MNRPTCTLWPEVNGEESQLYKDLLKKLGSRPLANLFYATYLASSDIDAKMDAAGYTERYQGQHKAKDLLQFLDFAKMQNEMGNLKQSEISLGAVDINGNRISFTNAEDTLSKADNFNNTHTGLVASVIKYSNPTGATYQLIVSDKTSLSQARALDVRTKMQVWNVYKQVFNAAGLDITTAPTELKDIFSAYNTSLAQTLVNLKKFVTMGNLYKKDAMTLLWVGQNNPEVQKAVNAFGSLEATAQAINDFNIGSLSLTPHQKTLLGNAIKEAKKLAGIDVDALNKQVTSMSQQLKNTSTEGKIQDVLHKLNKKYNIEINEIHRINDSITTLSEAVAEATTILQRQIRELERMKGNNAEGLKLESTLNQLMQELAAKRYCSGIYRFLQQASICMAEVDSMLQSIPQTGTELEKAMATAKILYQIDLKRREYYPLMSALADKNLIIDESISQADIDAFRNTAETLKDFFDKKKKLLNDFQESTMLTLMTEIVGSETPDGIAFINALRMGVADSTGFDRWLYSMGTASNPVIAAMGGIIRKAQDERTGIMNDIDTRITKATKKLHNSGSDSSFMYEEDGIHLISDIDWNAYEEARKTAIKGFKAQGLKGFDLKQEIENWEEANTEDREVEFKSHRKERVPNSNYRKAFPQLTKAQKDYYWEMYQIKGEIGNLLPAYAQQQFRVPQIRRNMVDALSQARSIGDVYKAFKNKVQDLWKVREDDTNYGSNGIIDGMEYEVTPSDVDNSPLKQIPIFFINRVEHSELLRDFSTGLQALAGTALNYSAMNDIADTVEFIGDFIKGQMPVDDSPKADVVENRTIRVVKSLRSWANNTNTATIVDGFINQALYGQYMAPGSSKEWNKFVGNIIQYTSFKGLSTNFKGAFANYIMGEMQMMLEAGAFEFYNPLDYIWAHKRLFGKAGATGEIWDALTESKETKSSLFADMFDPEQEGFESKAHKRYHKSMFRKLLSQDLSFIGYGSGEYLIHYVNMYAVLNHQKVKLNGKKVSLYEAFELVNKEHGTAELRLKAGVTRLNGDAITPEYIDAVRRIIRHVNKTCHGAMNKESKGLIYQHWYGRMAMNFRQWMVEHYSRRFRGRHLDAELGNYDDGELSFNGVREGYYTSVAKLLASDKTIEAYKEKRRWEAAGHFLADMTTFVFRAQTEWHNLDKMQKHNVRRALAEMTLLCLLYAGSFALGEPEDHKREFWRRFFIYQCKRMILDTEGSMPHPKIINNTMTILNSPMAGISTCQSALYTIFGLGDLGTEIKRGPHKGEDKYIRNICKYNLPFFKDYEQLEKLSDDDSIFKVFETSPTDK